MSQLTPFQPDRRRGKRLGKASTSLSKLGSVLPGSLPPSGRWPNGPGKPDPKPNLLADEAWEVEDTTPVVAAPDEPEIVARPIRGNILAQHQRETILKALRIGSGRALACEQADCMTRDLAVTMEDDPRFAFQVRDAENAAIDDVRLGMHEVAMNVADNPGYSLAYVKMRIDERNTAEMLRQGEEKLKIEKQVADDQTGRGSVNLDNLTDAEFSDFAVLHGRLEDGAQLTTSEMQRYVELMQKMSRKRPSSAPPSSPPGARPAAQLPPPSVGKESIQDVERLFGIDDNEGE